MTLRTATKPSVIRFGLSFNRIGIEMNNQRISIRRPVKWLAPHRQNGNGFTLVELLVVVAILAMLVGISAAVILPLREGRDIREAARSINAYLAAAQTRAMANQRPVGVWINRFSPDVNDLPRFNMALELVAAEVPPPYTGDYLSSRAIFSAEINNQAELTGISGVSIQPDRNDLIHRGDYIQFGFKGQRRKISEITNVNVNDDGSLTCIVVFDTPFRCAPGGEIPFQIFRFARPARSATAPLLLPPAVAIDIGNSGVGATGMLSGLLEILKSLNDPDKKNLLTGPAILFGPSGQIDLFIDGNPDPKVEPTPPAAPIHLLIGRPEKIGDDNLTDPNNLWLTIDHRTGRLSTSEVFTLPETSIAQSRKFAIDAQGISSR